MVEGRPPTRARARVVDLPDEASVVPVAEPLWSELNASVEMFPCMNADELRTGLGRHLAR